MEKYKHAYCVQGFLPSRREWWTIRGLATINEIVAAMKRHKGDPRFRVAKTPK